MFLRFSVEAEINFFRSEKLCRRDYLDYLKNRAKSGDMAVLDLTFRNMSLGKWSKIDPATGVSKEHSKTELGTKNFDEKFGRFGNFYQSKFSRATGVTWRSPTNKTPNSTSSTLFSPPTRCVLPSRVPYMRVNTPCILGALKLPRAIMTVSNHPVRSTV